MSIDSMFNDILDRYGTDTTAAGDSTVIISTVVTDTTTRIIIPGNDATATSAADAQTQRRASGDSPQMKQILRSIIDVPVDGACKSTIEQEDLRKNYAEFCKAKVKPETESDRKTLAYIEEHFKRYGALPSIRHLHEEARQQGDEDFIALIWDIAPERPFILSGYKHLLDRKYEEQCTDELHRILQNTHEIAVSGRKIGTTFERGVQPAVKYLTEHSVKFREQADDNIPANKYLTAPKHVYIAYPSMTVGSVTVIAGASTVGKTNVILNSMTHTQRGSSLYSRLEVMENHRVIMFTELAAPEIRERVNDLHLTLDETTTSIYHLDDFRGAMRDYQSFFASHIPKTNTPTLVYIDTIGSWCGVDILKDTQVSEMHNFFKQLAADTGTCICLVCHTRKKPNARRDRANRVELSDVAGSRYLTALADADILYDEVTDNDKNKVANWGSISFYKRSSVDAVYYYINDVEGNIEYHDQLPFDFDIDKTASPDNQQLIRTALASGPATTRQIAEKTSLNERTVQRIIRKMSDVEAQGNLHSPQRMYTLKSTDGVMGAIPLDAAPSQKAATGR